MEHLLEAMDQEFWKVCYENGLPKDQVHDWPLKPWWNLRNSPATAHLSPLEFLREWIHLCDQTENANANAGVNPVIGESLQDELIETKAPVISKGSRAYTAPRGPI